MERSPIGGIRRFIDIWRVINMVVTIVTNFVGVSEGPDSWIHVAYLWRDLGFFGDREVLVEKEGEVEAVHCF